MVDRDRGFAALAASLGDMGAITLGVQGKEALEFHPNPHGEGNITVGEIAAMHELGLGVPRRSWLLSWLDINRQKMLRQCRDHLRYVISRKMTRNQALIKLGFKWTEQLRENIDRDGVKGPALSTFTVERKGHPIKLLETGTLRNAITYRVFLPRKGMGPHGRKS